MSYYTMLVQLFLFPLATQIKLNSKQADFDIFNFYWHNFNSELYMYVNHHQTKSQQISQQ